MTSLRETLPILDEAVPALPGKVEKVAREGDEFHRAAQEAVAAFEHKRSLAQALAEQVRQALQTRRERAGNEQERLEETARALQETARDRARGVDEGGDELESEGERALTALGGLESQLVQAGEGTRAAHEEARTALEALGEEARSRQRELQAAGHEMTAAVDSARQAIAEGRTLVAQGVSALEEAMTRLLGAVQQRLGETYQRLDEVRAEQESAVSEAVSALETECQRLKQELEQRLDADLERALDPELAAVAGVVTEMEQRVARLEVDSASRREELAEEHTALAGRIPPLQGGAQQVKQAAAQVGIAWP